MSSSSIDAAAAAAASDDAATSASAFAPAADAGEAGRSASNNLHIGAAAEPTVASADAGHDHGAPRRPAITTLRSAQVEQLYANLFLSLWSNVIAGIGLSIYASRLDPSLVPWAGAVHASQLAWVAAMVAHRLASPAAVGAETWYRVYLVCTAANACLWGVASLKFLPGAGTPEAVLVMILALGMASGGVSTNTPSRMAAGIWLTGLLVPLAAGLAARGNALGITLGVATLAYWAIALEYAMRQSRALIDSINLQIENRRLVDQLRQQKVIAEQANRDKSRFLASASHDLRQPMHALGLFASAFEKSNLNPHDRHLLLNMSRCIESLDHSFNAMLDVSKLDAGVIEADPQSFEIRDVFRRLHMHFAGQAEAKGLQLRFKPGGRVAVTDPQLLERILTNLVGNAIKYTKEGGIVVVARGHGSHMSIEVRDTGPGIAEHELPHVFEEFYQIDNASRDRTHGLGMGLAIVKRLVMLLDHPLDVKSVVGRGTVFKLRVPQRDMDEYYGMNLEADTVPSEVGDIRKLLVIDDEEAIREGTRLLLERMGYEVLTAATIAEALEVVTAHGDQLQGVVSDLRLAHGEDGVDAITRVQAMLPAPVPAVLITGDTSQSEVRRAHESGHTVLFKPVQPRDLVNVLSRLGTGAAA
jgi:two-component system, sensor histidine kinase